MGCHPSRKQGSKAVDSNLRFPYLEPANPPVLEPYHDADGGSYLVKQRVELALLEAATSQPV
jgi:hypothetical protein